MQRNFLFENSDIFLSKESQEQKRQRKNAEIIGPAETISKQQQKIIQKGRRWSVQENILYTRFLKLNNKKFSVNDGDKKFRKYKKMSLYLVTKTPKQCRTHHQKMMIKFGTVQRIIEQLSLEKSEDIIIFKSVKQLAECEKNQSNQTFQQLVVYDSSKQEKSIPSYSSEVIFDILF